MGNQQAKDSCDLSEEKIEELRMLTSLPPKEIKRIRRRFLEYSEKSDDMNQEQFYMIPSVKVNPLKERLFHCFDTSQDKTINFTEFISVMASFSYHGQRDSKIRNAFKIHDFDNDGKISRKDLMTYLELVADFGELSSEEEIKSTIEVVVSRTMEEASSDPALEFLSFDDFVKIITSTDFETKLVIQI